MEKQATKTLALFDFDGTITTEDSMLAFLKFYSGSLHFYLSILIISPLVLLMHSRIISRKLTKELLWKMHFRNHHYKEFCQKAEIFAKEHLPKNLNQTTIHYLDKHLKNNDKVLIVSASPDAWISPWASKKGIEVISTRLKIDNERLTGSIEGENCNGTEKVRRIKEAIELEQYTRIFAYGNSKGDQEMLALADSATYIKK